MTTSCRPCWRNCALETDPEILAIDRMEDGISPLDPNVARIRELVSSLELCHHKAGHWVDNILQAIAAGDTSKGLGTRPLSQSHPVETIWQNACAALSAWCDGCPSGSIDLCIDTIPASRMLNCLGERSALKEWQVARIIQKIRNSIHWPKPLNDPTAQYVWILIGLGEGDSLYRSQCPDHYKEHEDFWLATARTVLVDTENGDEAELSLGLAIDMLWPCHWNFVENLQIVLQAIGGRLRAEKPFAACGRNIALTPIRKQMETVSNTLRAFCGHVERDEETDGRILGLFGEPTETKKWLAASLAKTIQLQLHPPADMRAISALTGPDWLRQ